MSRRRQSWRAWMALYCVGLALAAVAGVLTARPPAAQALAPAPSRVPHLDRLVGAYPQAALLPLGDTLMIDGVGREMAYSLTPDAPRTVAAFYTRAWKRQELVVHETQQGEALWVTATSPRDLWVRTISAQPARGRTVLVASVASLAAQPEKAAMPLPPNCTTVQHSAAQDRHTVRRLALLRCEGYVGEVAHFYDRMLAEAQRQTPWDLTGNQAAFVTYEAPHRVVSVAATQASASPPIVAATITWQEEQP